MARTETLARILESGVVAVVRAESSESLVPVVRALAEGGVSAIEITFTVPDALEVIRGVRRELGQEVVLGAGTVLDPETARAALLAGAEFVVSPVVNVETIRLVRRYGAVMMPGAFSPTEVLSAWEHGADVVKIFPAEVGGPGYLKALRGPSAAGPPDADRRRGPGLGRGVPQGRRLLSRGGLGPGRSHGRRRQRLPSPQGAGRAVFRHRSPVRTHPRS